MKRYFIILFLIFVSTASFAAPASRTRPAARTPESLGEILENDYAQFKKMLEKDAGLTYSLDVSIMPQYNLSGDGKVAWQNMNSGTANLNMIESDRFGCLSAQAAAISIWYPTGFNAQELSDRISAVSPVNPYPQNTYEFDRLSLTYALPGKLKNLSLTVGQFPIYMFDGVDYNSNPQVNFINNSLSQNGSMAYPVASLGGYLSFAATDELTVLAGVQDAANISPRPIRISTAHLGEGKVISFGSVSYQPTIKDWGGGQYNLLIYHQPFVEGQPQESFGWSANALQHFGDLGVFVGANGTDRTLTSIKQSYAVGAVYNNPWNRNSLDQIGVAYVSNRNNPDAAKRDFENIIEVYLTLGISSYFILTPDIQFFINPGNSQKSQLATVASLRLTGLF
jgi:hypothetical protein